MKARQEHRGGLKVPACPAGQFGLGGLPPEGLGQDGLGEDILRPKGYLFRLDDAKNPPINTESIIGRPVGGLIFFNGTGLIPA